VKNRKVLAVVVGGAIVIGLYTIADRCGGAPEAGGETAGETGEPPEAGGSETARFQPSAPPRSAMRFPIALARATSRAAPDRAAGSLGGTVVSSTGGPIEGAELSFERNGVLSSARSDVNGRFEFAPAEPGRYALAIATADGYLPYAPALGHSPIAFDAEAGRAIDGVEIALTPAIEYTGEVVDAEGAPVEGATIALVDDAGAPESLVPLEREFVSDAEGRFRFRAPDGAVLEARHPEHGAARARVDLPAQISKRVTLRLGELDESRTAAEIVSGRVLDTRDRPIEGALVSATFESENRASEDARDRPRSFAVTDTLGSFVLSGLDRGRYRLVVQSTGHAGASEVVTAPAEGVRIVLGAELAIEGTVVDRSDRPVPAATVIAERVIGPLERATVGAVTSYGSEGRFRVGGLGPGTYVLTALALEAAPSADVTVELTDASETVELTVSVGGRLLGRVTDEASGAAIEGARVELETRRGGDDSPVSLRAGARSDADGRYVLDGVPSGLQSIFVSAGGHHARILSGISVGEGEARTIDVALAPAADGEAPRLELAGIGAVLSGRGDALVIGEVLEGGGARSAGLVPGDAVLAVDGALVTDLGFGESIQRIRGPEGSTVVLRVRRADGAVVELRVTRSRVRA
jgi:protocatechuate 3,4-dioxygenase beta subunit